MENVDNAKTEETAKKKKTKKRKKTENGIGQENGDLTEGKLDPYPHICISCHWLRPGQIYIQCHACVCVPMC